jgi:hypothetical protein
MSLRFIDSFDHYASADLAKKYTSVGGSPVIEAGGRNSTSRFRAGAGEFVMKTLDAQSTWIVGVAFRVTTLPSSGGQPIIRLQDAGSVQAQVQIRAAGELQVTRGGTSLVISSGLGLTVDTWYFLEFKAVIGNAGAGSYDVRINGSSVLSGSADTSFTANQNANQVVLWAPQATTWFDDLYICDGQGSVNNNFLGDRRVMAVRPDGAGNYSQWTPSAGSNYQNVDESAPDSDTTYNSSATAGQIDTYTFGALGVVGTVHGIQTSLLVRHDDSTRTIREKVRISGSDYNGANVSTGASYAYALNVRETNPATSAAWAVSEIDAAEAGVEFIS